MYYTIKGLVLNSKPQAESDKLVTLYSYEWGKIYAVVPGAKKIAAKLSFAAEPVTESEFMVCQSHASMRPKITGAKIINNNTAVKTDFKRNLYALYAAEIADKFAPSNAPNEEKYCLLQRVWEIFAKCENPKRVLTAFSLRFLKLSGYGFADYLKNHGSFSDKTLERAVKKLSSCSGDDADLFHDYNDDAVWNYVETYMTNYVKKPSVGVFLKKLEGFYDKKNFSFYRRFCIDCKFFFGHGF
ncbi:MAG: DNA repair protein RecO [Endomicrobium sp.]|jgi:DNA repair protein RecO (recombination protein O)|nr:DNA repair protein RecO [Endomicrobium sp.]